MNNIKPNNDFLKWMNSLKYWSKEDLSKHSLKTQYSCMKTYSILTNLMCEISARKIRQS